MNASTEFDTGPLSWVKNEIDLALERAANALNAYAESAAAGNADLSHIQYCRTHLHQVQGALIIVGLDGVRQLTEALEALLEAMETGTVAANRANIALTYQGLQGIGSYLDALLAGQNNQPLRLFPLYAATQKARGIEHPSPADLFFPDLSVRPPHRASPAAKMPETAFQEHLRQERGRFQRGLLAWLRAPQQRDGIADMLDAVKNIDALQESASARAFWWVATALLTALSEGALPQQTDAKQVCARIDLQIRRMIEGSKNVAERLMRDLLYLVAVCQSTHPAIEQIRHAYRLREALQIEETPVTSAAQESILRHLHEAIAAAEDAWNKFCAGAPQALPPFREHALAIASLVNQLGRTDYQRLAQALAITANNLREDASRHSDALAMEVATGLLLAQNAQENFTHLGNDFAHQVDITVARIHGCLAGAPPKADAEIPLLDEMSRKAQERLLIAQVAREIQGNLGQIEQALDTFFRNAEVRDGLPALDAIFHQTENALTLLGHDGAVSALRACHQEAERFAQPDYVPQDSDFQRIANELSLLGFYVDAIPGGATDFAAFVEQMQKKPGEVAHDDVYEEHDEALDLGSLTVEQEVVQQKREAQNLLGALLEQPEDAGLREELRQNLTALKDDAELVADATLSRQADAALTALDEGQTAAPKIQEAIASLQTPGEKTPQPSEATLQLSQASAEEIDAELLEIFIEEAHEVLATVGENTQRVRQHPHDIEALTTVRRAFHTLKGSGRMVGLKDLGETAWAIEQTLNLWLRQEQEVTPALMALLEQAKGCFDEWVEHLASHSGAVPETASLVALAETLRRPEGAKATPSAAAAKPGEAATKLSTAAITSFIDQHRAEAEAADQAAAVLTVADVAEAPIETPASVSAPTSSKDSTGPSDGPVDDWAAILTAADITEAPVETPPAVTENSTQATDGSTEDQAAALTTADVAEPPVEKPPEDSTKPADVVAEADDAITFTPAEAPVPQAAPDAVQSPEPEAQQELAGESSGPDELEETIEISTPGDEAEDDADFELAFADDDGITVEEASDTPAMPELPAEQETLDITEAPAAPVLTPPEIRPIPTPEADVAPAPQQHIAPVSYDDNIARALARVHSSRAAKPPETRATPESLPDIALPGEQPAAPESAPPTAKIQVQPSAESPATPKIQPISYADILALATGKAAPKPSAAEHTAPTAPQTFKTAAPTHALTPEKHFSAAPIQAVSTPAAPQPRPTRPDIPAALLSIFREESSTHLATLYRELPNIERADATPTPHEMYRAAHTLAGIAATVGIDALNQLSHALEKALLRRDDSPLRNSPDAPGFIRQAVQVIDAMLDALFNKRDFRPAEALIAALNTLYPIDSGAPSPLDADTDEAEITVEEIPSTLNGDVEDIAVEAVDIVAPEIEDIPTVSEKTPAPARQTTFQAPPVFAPSAVPPAATSTAAASPATFAAPLAPPAATAKAPDITPSALTVPEAPAEAPILPAAIAALPHRQDEIDMQLLPIFLEEAQDLTQRISEQLRIWYDAPEDGQPAQLLARLLHTLKGSARMAGAMNLGEITHAIESRVQEASRTLPAARSVIGEIESVFDDVRQIIDRLQHGETLEAPAPEAEGAAAPALSPAVSAPIDQAPAASVLPAPQPAAPIRAPRPEPHSAAAESEGRQATLRVRANLLDRLVNEAGELSITRTRIEGEMRSLKGSLLDLTESVIRLRRQLRDIEIQAETQMQSRNVLAQSQHAEFDPLEFDRFTQFQEITRMMAESVNDVTTVQQNLLRNLDNANAALLAQSRINHTLHQELLSVRMVQAGSLSDRLYRIVRQTSKELGKRVSLELTGGQVEIDRTVLEKIAAPLEHMLRNSIAHGIEKRDIRQAAGKAETGEISLAFRQEGNEVIVSLSDDGAGLNLERIRARAIESGLIRQDETPDEAQLAQLILLPGFSTARQVSQISGRGVGMDVVKSEITSLGGRIEIASESGKGTQFTLYIPLTLAVTKALLVRVGNRSYAIPSAMIEQALDIKDTALDQMHRDGQVKWQGESYPLTFLPYLLGDTRALPEERRQYWVLLLHSGARRIAVQVDELEGNHEIVVKNIGEQLARVVGIDGATVLGDGKIVLIINPVALSARAPIVRYTPIAAPASPAVAQPARVPTVMVVDDSLTVRKITGRLLAREGYHVLTAKDGVDALEQLVEATPDVMLVDIEMPRMDGFELTRHVRADGRLRAIPIIMITSRTAQKHRNYAFEIGVNNFLGKPYQEEELLALIAQHVRQARGAADNRH